MDQTTFNKLLFFLKETIFYLIYPKSPNIWFSIFPQKKNMKSEVSMMDIETDKGRYLVTIMNEKQTQAGHYPWN